MGGNRLLPINETLPTDVARDIQARAYRVCVCVCFLTTLAQHNVFRSGSSTVCTEIYMCIYIVKPHYPLLQALRGRLKKRDGKIKPTYNNNAVLKK